MKRPPKQHTDRPVLDWLIGMVLFYGYAWFIVNFVGGG